MNENVHPPAGTVRRSRTAGARDGLILALIVSTVLATAVGFWLSYAGLHAFAVRSGLSGPEAWAWPASVDLFILAGELGVTISAIRGERDKIAWAYLAGGFVLSVAFNVSHVLPSVMPWGPYVVAATPPIAAMLALAALMRQVFRTARTSGDAVPAAGYTDAETEAEKALRRTWEAGNPLNQNQLETQFRLTRAEARKVRERVIPQTPVPAVSAASVVPPADVPPPGPAPSPNGRVHVR